MSADFQTLCSFHKNSWDQEGWNKANWVHACTYWMWESTFWYSKTHTDIPHSYIIYSYADKQVQQDRLLAVAHAALRPRQFKRLADRTATNEDVVKFKKTGQTKITQKHVIKRSYSLACHMWGKWSLWTFRFVCRRWHWEFVPIILRQLGWECSCLFAAQPILFKGTSSVLWKGMRGKPDPREKI